ncbi:hypothetical protein KA005_62180 [bacterium]|nr:hypothetical protein [bacterium]
MKTKIAGVIVISILVILFLSILIKKQSDRSTYNSVSSPKPSTALKKDSEAEALLIEVMNAMQRVVPEDGALPKPGWKKEENFQKLYEIVQKYPDTESSRTAKLLISHIYFDSDNPRHDVAKGKAIILEIQKNFSGTWQATIAEVAEGGLLCLKEEWKAAVPYLEKGIGKIEELEEKPNNGYTQYKKVIQNGRDYDLKGNMLEALMYSYCMTGNLEKAKAVCERLIKECPGHPQSDFAKRALKKLQDGRSPYYTPPKETKEEIAEEIRKVDED